MNEYRYVSGDNRPIFFRIVSFFDDNGNKVTDYSGYSVYLTVADKDGNVLFQVEGAINNANGIVKFPMQSSYTANLKGEYSADVEFRNGVYKSTAYIGNTNKIRFIILEDITQ